MFVKLFALFSHITVTGKYQWSKLAVLNLKNWSEWQNELLDHCKVKGIVVLYSKIEMILNPSLVGIASQSPTREGFYDPFNFTIQNYYIPGHLLQNHVFSRPSVVIL